MPKVKLLKEDYRELDEAVALNPEAVPALQRSAECYSKRASELMLAGQPTKRSTKRRQRELELADIYGEIARTLGAAAGACLRYQEYVKQEKK
jgi:hypothetical protein